MGREKTKVKGERGTAGVWMREGRLGFGCEEARRKFFVYVYFFFIIVYVYFFQFVFYFLRVISFILRQPHILNHSIDY